MTSRQVCQLVEGIVLGEEEVPENCSRLLAVQRIGWRFAWILAACRFVGTDDKTKQS